MIIKELECTELTPVFLQDFGHRQRIRHVWEKADGQWTLKDVNVIREWNDEKRAWIPQYLKEMMEEGGCTFAAYEGNKLTGFITLDGCFGGTEAQYLNLAMFFVDDSYKRQGIGRQLFSKCAERAIQMGAEKLFISAVPSEETVAFYIAMGCRDAEEIIPEFVDTPEDRYLEYDLKFTVGC